MKESLVIAHCLGYLALWLSLTVLINPFWLAAVSTNWAECMLPESLITAENCKESQASSDKKTQI